MATLLLAFSLLSATYEHGAPEQSLAFQAFAFSPYMCTATPSHQLLRTNPSWHWWKFRVWKWAPFEPPWEAERTISQPVLASAHLAGAAPGGENTGCLFWAWSASTSLLENSPCFRYHHYWYKTDENHWTKMERNSEGPQFTLIYKNLFCS